MTVSARQARYLNAMGLTIWSRRMMASISEPSIINDRESLQGPSKPIDKGQDLAAEISACTCCVLHKTRTQAVFGVGDMTADWMVIGEAPGAQEDRVGEPFVGRAGQLLDAMLIAIGLSREVVFITNVIKCRPPKNRDPDFSEIEACGLYLRKQIDQIAPKFILVLGRIAAQSLLNNTVSVGKLRGQVYRYGNEKIPLVVTYHPAYLLRRPIEKRKVWQDLCLAVNTYRGI